MRLPLYSCIDLSSKHPYFNAVWTQHGSWWPAFWSSYKCDIFIIFHKI